MAQEVSLSDQDAKTSDTFEEFLNRVTTGTKERVDNFVLPLIKTAGNERDSQNGLSKQLEDALAQSDVIEVWKLIAEISETDSNKTLENINEVCKNIVERENNKEKGCRFRCSWDIDCGKIWETIKKSIRNCCACMCTCLCTCLCTCSVDEFGGTAKTEMRNEEERRWIEILSNPLYICLEWLWRNNPSSQYKIRRKESKFADIIEAALDDAYLLEKIASYEHYYSRDEYKRRAEEYETFAADIVEQVDTSDLNQLHEIMDINGNGSLLNKTPANFNQSLSLLKLAADKKRKRFVASPNCQYVLNEIVYLGWRNWQDQGIVRKALWFLLQFVLVAIVWPLYIPIRLVRLCCCSKFKDICCWKLRRLYELPYSKLINHTMSYVLFLCLVFTSSFQEEFGTTETGLARIDYWVLAFVAGLFLQEASEAIRQGFLNYFSKWWNVVDTLIVFAFLLSYTVWLTAWGYYGKYWKPRKSAFIVADTIYASATVMAFFHLAHVFQINSVLGPLQLSLYKMLKDVLKFLAVFLLLYVAFATGVAKIYSYYVASQIKLGELNDSRGYNPFHPYGKHSDAFIGVFWLLLGLVEEDKISVEDPAFSLTATFGRTFMIAHVVCTVIVALNMLIAMMNNSFDRIMENALVEWKFSRTRMWLEYIDKGNAVPVPLNLVYAALRLLCCLCCSACCCQEGPNDPEQGNSQRGSQRERPNNPEESDSQRERPNDPEQSDSQSERPNDRPEQSDSQRGSEYEMRNDPGQSDSQRDSQREGENHEEENCIPRRCPRCCSLCIRCCFCSCGIKGTIGCTCCSRKTSMREGRMEVMTTLVVKYLKDRYSARWKELTAKATEHRKTSEPP